MSQEQRSQDQVADQEAGQAVRPEAINHRQARSEGREAQG